MKYINLIDLLQNSSSTRKYFLSLPVYLQMELHEKGEYIHTAAELHHYRELMEIYDRQIQNTRFF